MPTTFTPGNYKHLPLLLLLAVGTMFAWHNAFTQDDAYISYRYAKHFAQGYGLVWYPGSTEFGFTNFLYTFLIGLFMLAGLPPETASNIINYTSFIGALIIAYDMARRMLENKVIALIPIFLLVTHHSFTSYATGGLETMWSTLLLLAFYWHILTAHERSNSNQFVRVGAIASLAMLTRLDMVLLLIPGYVFMLFSGMRGVTVQNGIRQLLRIKDAIIIPVVVMSTFLLLCHYTYGQILPNTFYIKMPGDSGMMIFGVHYLLLYNALHLYLPLLVPLLIMYFSLKKGSLARIGEFTLCLMAAVAVWLYYIAYVGGDFMEFRFLVPVLPLYYLCIFRLIIILIEKRTALVLVLVCVGFTLGTMSHTMLFHTKPNSIEFNGWPRSFNYAFVESTDTLYDWVNVPKRNWRAIGKGLGKLFYTGKPTDVKIAVGNAGAVPYFSGLPTFDMLGLNSRTTYETDPETGQPNFRYAVKRPGHAIIATRDVLVREGVNLNIAFPHALCLNSGRYLFAENPVRVFPFARRDTLLLPLGNDCFSVADYLTPHPRVDELIQKKVILRFDDIRTYSDCPPWLCLYKPLQETPQRLKPRTALTQPKPTPKPRPIPRPSR